MAIIQCSLNLSNSRLNGKRAQIPEKFVYKKTKISTNLLKYLLVFKAKYFFK